MRTTIAIVLTLALGAACGKGADQGAEEARKQAEKEQKEKVAAGGAATKLIPPVPNRAKLECASLINAAQFKQVLGEVEDITVVDVKNADATASCSLLRGGKKLTRAEQEAKLKKEPRLGVMAGEEICNVATFCWTIEDAERFRKKCTAEFKENKDDESLGFYACMRVIMTGANDVNTYKFFDDDTKCITEIHAGPSNVDNDLIGKCAKAAHDLIGPDQIKVGAAPAAPAAPAEAPAAGSGSGS